MVRRDGWAEERPSRPGRGGMLAVSGQRQGVGAAAAANACPPPLKAPRRAPLVDGLEVARVLRWLHRVVAVERLFDLKARRGDGVKVARPRRGVREQPLRQAQLGQRRRVRQALQHAVHEARVAQVDQAHALQSDQTAQHGRGGASSGRIGVTGPGHWALKGRGRLGCPPLPGQCMLLLQPAHATAKAGRLPGRRPPTSSPACPGLTTRRIWPHPSCTSASWKNSCCLVPCLPSFLARGPGMASCGRPKPSGCMSRHPCCEISCCPKCTDSTLPA